MAKPKIISIGAFYKNNLPDGVTIQITYEFYKDRANYLGSKGTPVTEIKRWHVGSRRSKVLKKIRVLLSPAHRGAG